MKKSLIPSPFLLLLPLVLMGAKCPEFPPLGPPRGGHTGSGGTGGSVHDGGVRDGGLGVDGGPDARSDAAGGDAGSAATCVPASPTDVWVPEAVTVSPSAESTVSSISALTPSDAWMATQLDVEHWDGTSWSSVPSVTPGSLLAVAHDDVWLANQKVQDWNGTSWIDHTPPSGSAEASYRIWGRNSTDLWVTDQAIVPNRVLHWNGSSWSDRTPTIVDNTTALWGASANDVWATAVRTAGQMVSQILIHWTGATWQEGFDIPVTNGLQAPYLYAIWGSSGHDVWAFANDGVTHLWHFDGSTWTNEGELSVGASSLWGSCSNNYWAVSQNQYAHFDGATWTIGTLTGTATLRVVGGSGPDDVWIGGDNNQNNAVMFHHLPGDPAPACGNVRLDPGEQCDPPDGTRCGPDCQRLIVCGDGFIEAGEDCDPPNGVTCSAYCHFIPTCGNGVLDPGEQCDPPGITGNGLICNANCQRPTCGNGVIDPGEACDPPFKYPTGLLWCDSTCQRPTCGNGVIDPGEACDPPQSWQPARGSPLYCGNSCTLQNACTDCHTLCDPEPIPFSECAAELCNDGPFSPCG